MRFIIAILAFATTVVAQTTFNDIIVKTNATIQSGTLNMSGKRIVSLGSASAGTDAVNLSQLNAAVAAVSINATFPDSTGELARLTDDLRGTGRTAILTWPFNQEGFGSTNGGSFYSLSLTNRWVNTGIGDPGYLWLRELSSNSWMGYLGYSLTFGTTNTTSPNVTYYGVWEPMLKSLCGATGWSDQDGGAVAYPLTLLTPANLWYQWSSASLSTPATNVTRLGVIRGPSYNTAPLCKVYLTNSLGVSVVPNLLPTATQYIQMGGRTNILVANGGEFAPGDYVLDTSYRSGQSPCAGFIAFNHPIADGLVPDAYTLRIQMTTNAPSSESSVERIYLTYITYGFDGLTESSSGATLERQGFRSSGADNSSSETYTLQVRPQGTGTYYLIGGQHANNSPVAGEQSLTLTNKVNGEGIVSFARSVSRARSGANVATIVTDRYHKLSTGDLVSLYKFGGTGYNVGEVAVTVTAPNAFTISNTGGPEGTTPDTAGWIIPNKVWTGSFVTTDRQTQFLYAGTNVANAISRYQFDVSGWHADSFIQTTAALDFGTQTYLGLNTSWGGDPNLGPQFGGQQQWRIIGTTTGGTLTSTASGGIVEPGSLGQYAGIVQWGATNGWATAFFSQTPNMQMDNWATGNFFLQGRGSASNPGLLGKVYFQWTTTNTVLNVAAGKQFRIRNMRLDAQLTDANSLAR